jgi:2-succinyl-6-hydroxy-2,4-cyclohexadiene-1-carboxylate synthase
MSIINIQGVSHFYHLTAPTNNRPVLVFVHGWMLSQVYWQPLIKILSPEFQCLSYDQRGFGESQPVINPLGYAEDLKLLLQELNINHAWVIGHSLGGTIALQAADIFPEVIQGVTCVNAGGGLYLKDEFTKFVTAGQQIVKFRPRWFVNIPGFDLLFARSNVVKPLDKSWGKQRIMDFVGADYHCALGSLLASTTEEEVTNLPRLMSRLKQPVYFVAGHQDDIMPVKFVRYLADFHYLEDHVLELDKCGHLAMLEQTEAIANYLREILRNY